MCGKPAWTQTKLNHQPAQPAKEMVSRNYHLDCRKISVAAAEGASFREMFLGEKKKAGESLIHFLEADEQLPTML